MNMALHKAGEWLSIHQWRLGLWVLLSLLILWLYEWSPQWWQQSRLVWQDQLRQHWLQAAPTPDVVVVDIDETSLALLGPWPWNRQLMAQLVRRLHTNYQAAAIGLDVVFPDTSQPKADDALVEAIVQTRTIVGVVWDYVGQTPALRVGQLQPTSLPLQHLQIAQGYLANYSQLAAQAQVGHISPQTDALGIVRYMPPFVDWQSSSYPMMPLALLAQAHRLTWQPHWQERCLYPFALSNIHLCVNAQRQWQIPYRYDQQKLTVIPAWRVLADQLDKQYLSGKIVLVGASAMGLSDRVATPLSPVTPGVMVHAQMIQSLLDPQRSDVLAGPPISLFIVVAWLLLAYALVRYGVWQIIALVTILILSWLWWVGVDYQQGDEMPDVALPIVAILLAVFSHLALEWTLVRRHAYRLYHLFKDYLPSSVLQQLSHHPDPSLLQPQQRVVTILFADIVGFTRMTEAMPTQEAAELTRQILSIFTQAVYHNQGTLDKYMGDSVMAFWNAPLPQTDHRQWAVQAARDIRQRMFELNQLRQDHGLPKIVIHIGINTGEVLVGDLGTQWRHAYTVLGDAVNVAQRLMSAATEYHTDVAMGMETAKAIDGAIPLGTCRLQGRQQIEFIFGLST